MAKKVGDIVAARLRKYARTGKIVLAPQAEIDRFAPDFIDDFLDRIFQVSGALFTDDTRLSDFVSFGNDPHDSAEAVAKVRAEYGISVDLRAARGDSGTPEPHRRLGGAPRGPSADA